MHDHVLVAFLERAWLDYQVEHPGTHDVVPDVFAVPGCRSPGHHAPHGLYGGYCFFNNAAIAAHHIAAHHIASTTGVKVSVLDVDHHHGNATQQIFIGSGSELVVVSLGVDTHERDPISDLAVTTEGFARQGEAVAGLDLPVVIVQEGGYDIDTIGVNVVAFVSQHPW